MKEIKVGVIGCGGRGVGNFYGDLTVNDNLSMLGIALKVANIKVVALCDIRRERAETTAQKLIKKGYEKPLIFTDYKELLKCDEINTILVFTSWESHVAIAIDAMKAGKAVGMEVGGAASVDECFKLVETWEETKSPFMFLENCCFNKDELRVQNLVRAGKFGDVVYCHGAYVHDLRKEIITGKENGHYRLKHYINRNCDNYPTHALGPICKIIDINRGNKMNTLYSVGTKALGLKQRIKDLNEKGELANKDLLNIEFKQADIVDTLITCENGEVISLRLDTTLPSNHSRELEIKGTKGRYTEINNSVLLDDNKDNVFLRSVDNTVLMLNSADRLYYDYLPKSWTDLTEEERKSGHGGADYPLFKSFFKCLAEDKPMPIDVYDAAAWMCISPLSEESLKTGKPVEIPDFTKGKWKSRERLDIE